MRRTDQFSGARLIHSCAAFGVNPHSWLTETFTKLAAGHPANAISNLIPWTDVDQARVVGRIGAFLDAVRPSESEPDLTPMIETAKRRVETLEAAVDADDVAQRLDT